jgi:N-acetylmuramoyl-L-alanine amidase
MISYFIYTIISLGCSYALYVLLLRKQKTFQFNRFFLLSSILLCLIAPVLEFEIFKFVPSITEIPIETFTESVVDFQNLEDLPFGTVEIVSKTQQSPLFYMYLAITLFLVFRFLKNLFQLYLLTRHESKRFGKLKLIKTSDSEMVSSFFNYLFINERQTLNDEAYLSVIKHETVHCQELHTIDVIVIELLMCVLWFNPFVWLYKKAMLQNHEYIADDYSVSSGIDIEKYSNTIINLGYKEHRVPLTSGFNFIQIKNRIIMLHQSKTSVLNRTLKITSVILLFAGIFVFSSYKDLKEPLVVVIDAGHGGEDPGQLSGTIKEKDIVLKISKYLEALSDDKLKIMTTRNSDDFSSLEERVKFINKQKPDVFVSLHCNGHTDNTVSGVEAYYYESENVKRLNKSMNYSSTLAVSLMRQNFDKARINSSKFKILKQVESPAILLELGFLTNKEDLSRVSNARQQQEIAKAIYDGILQASRIKI